MEIYFGMYVILGGGINANGGPWAPLPTRARPPRRRTVMPSGHTVSQLWLFFGRKEAYIRKKTC